MKTWIQRLFQPIRRFLPRSVAKVTRSAVTALFTPAYSFYQRGHFRSSFAGRAVDRFGRPLPWYTYPCIDFLRVRDFSDKTVLEFGAGESTLWWSNVARSVAAIEGDRGWYTELVKRIPGNVSLFLVDCSTEAVCVQEVKLVMGRQPATAFDVIIIDGLYRRELVPVAIKYLAPGGAIVCDDSEGYGIGGAFQGTPFKRIDFYGNAPGVVLQHCTSIFFRDDCFLLRNDVPIADALL